MILVGSGPAADAKRRLLERAGAVFVQPNSPAMLAVVADDDEEAAAALKARGLLVNVVDRPDVCDFTLPAIVDRNPVLIAIGTGGVSAGLAAALRQRLEAVLPASLGRVAEALHGARDTLRGLYPDTGERRRAIGAMLAEGGSLDPFVDHPAPEVVSELVVADRMEQVVIRSPDPEELTLRAARLLALADRIFHPADMPTAILDRARADAERIPGPLPVTAPPGLTVHLMWDRA